MSVLTQPGDEDYYTDPIYTDPYATDAEDAQRSQPETTFARSARTGPVDPAQEEAANTLLGFTSSNDMSATETYERRATEAPPTEVTSQDLQHTSYKRNLGFNKAQMIAFERATQVAQRRRDARVAELRKAQSPALESTTQVSESRPATDASKWLTQVPVPDSTPPLSERMSDYAAENLESNTASRAPEPRRSDSDIADRMSVSNIVSKN